MLDDEPCRKRVDDEEARAILHDLMGGIPIQELSRMEPSARSAHLMEARRKGLSIRQLVRLTGIGYGIIAKAKQGQSITPPSL